MYPSEFSHGVGRSVICLTEECIKFYIYKTNQGFKICSSDDENGIFSYCEHRQEVLDFFSYSTSCLGKQILYFPLYVTYARKKWNFMVAEHYSTVSVHLLEKFWKQNFS